MDIKELSFDSYYTNIGLEDDVSPETISTHLRLHMQVMQ